MIIRLMPVYPSGNKIVGKLSKFHICIHFINSFRFSFMFAISNSNIYQNSMIIRLMSLVI